MPPKFTPSELKAEITGHQYGSRIEESEIRAQQLTAAALYHVRGLQDLYASRRLWSIFLVCCITASLAFQIGITIAVGLKLLDFTQYRWFLPIVASENFIQIVGLALIVLKWLFSGSTPKNPF